jgi:hypothetical protein
MEQKLETHQEALDRLKLQVGDKVKVLEKAESFKRGWSTCWLHNMDKTVGETGIITSISYDGISVKRGLCGIAYYTAYVLEVVERAKDAVTTTAKAPTDFLEKIIEKHNTAPTSITVLQEAESLIYGDREKDYGKTSDNFKDIAKGWEVIAKTTITPEQVGLMMAWLKICRANKDNCEKRDSLVDLAGYAGCIEKIKKGL